MPHYANRYGMASVFRIWDGFGFQHLHFAMLFFMEAYLMKVLILGGNGYLGPHVVKALEPYLHAARHRHQRG